MSLHGTIQVNGHVIGAWTARRGHQVDPGVHEYQVMLSENLRQVTGTVVHRYTDGASILASKVLSLRPADWPVPPLHRLPATATTEPIPFPLDRVWWPKERPTQETR
jgi:hypothetical protein